MNRYEYEKQLRGRDLTLAERGVLKQILEYTKPNNLTAWPSAAKLAQDLNCTERYVYRQTSGLAKKGYLTIDSGRTGKANFYILTLPDENPTDANASPPARQGEKTETGQTAITSNMDNEYTEEGWHPAHDGMECYHCGIPFVASEQWRTSFRPYNVFHESDDRDESCYSKWLAAGSPQRNTELNHEPEWTQEDSLADANS